MDGVIKCCTSDWDTTELSLLCSEKRGGFDLEGLARERI